jgi:hypothetical protein
VEAEASAKAGDGAAEHPGLVGNGGGRSVAVRYLGVWVHQCWPRWQENRVRLFGSVSQPRHSWPYIRERELSQIASIYIHTPGGDRTIEDSPASQLIPILAISCANELQVRGTLITLYS